MNIVTGTKKFAMILTILLALSCGINPIHQGAPEKFNYYFPPAQQVAAVAPQDTVKPAAPRKLTPEQIERMKQVDRAFASVENISKAMGDITMSQKELVKANKTLVAITMRLKKDNDSIKNFNRSLRGELQSTKSENRLQGEKMSNLIEKTDNDRIVASSFRTMVTQVSTFFFIPFCFIGTLAFLALGLLKIKEVTLRNRLTKYEG